MSNSSPLVFGVLLATAGVQLLDFAALDVLAIFSPDYLKEVPISDSLKAYGRPIEFKYIVDQVKGNGEAPNHVDLTGNSKVVITDTLDSVGYLDYLFIPGPPPSYVPSADTIAFIQKHASSARAILTVCTGIVPLLYTGILSGKSVTGPLSLIPFFKEKAPDAEWQARRWVVGNNGKLWSSGGVTNGLDMMAAFVKTIIPSELANTMIARADINDRGQDYPEELLATIA